MKHDYGGYNSKATFEYKTLFGNMVRSQREWRGLSQATLGRYVGVTHKAISQYERGESFPRRDDMFLRIIDKLEFPKENIWRLFDEGGIEVRKCLQNDPKTKAMLDLREQGLTNKKIAEAMATPVSEVYERIGKKADSFMIAEQNGKEPPVPVVTPISEENEPVITPINEESKPVQSHSVSVYSSLIPTEPASLLKERRVVKIVDLEGMLCNYEVNQQTGMVELTDYENKVSMVHGCLDSESIDVFIAELQEIKELLRDTPYGR